MRKENRVLVVDDDRSVLITLDLSLRENGFQPTLCSSGQGALALIEHSPTFGLVLCDYVMPKMDGLELAGRIKAIDPTVPVVLMTGHPDLLPEILHRGVVPLVKPFSMDLLHSVVADLVSQPLPPSAATADRARVRGAE